MPRHAPWVAAALQVSLAPPYAVDDANFKKLVAILRVAVPYTGMILSTRESPEMRRELLRVGMSQMSAGSKTDVGAYHRCAAEADALGCGGVPLRCCCAKRLCLVGSPLPCVCIRVEAETLIPTNGCHCALCRDDSEATEEHLGDLKGQFSLMDHRPGAHLGCTACAAVHRAVCRGWYLGGGVGGSLCLNSGWLNPLRYKLRFLLLPCCPPHPAAVEDIVMDLMQAGNVPSWCTACYRKGGAGRDEGGRGGWESVGQCCTCVAWPPQ